jgi:nucleotide-binding universal stress UspA family protein
MVAFRRILCPIDFSEPSRRAFEYALSLARSHRARLTMLHVMFAPFSPQPPAFSVDLVDERRRLTERECRLGDLRAWIRAHHGDDVPGEAIVDEGHAAARILEHARSGQADLVVMGSHGLSGFDRLVLGSITEKVLRKAACPVMTVPPALQAPATLTFSRILCPVDFSDSAQAALCVACSVADEASVTILHVFDWPTDDEALFERVVVPEYRHIVEQDARERLDALARKHTRNGATPRTRVAHGKPYREILRVAEDEQADLIVMGVRGRNPIDLALFGSTTNQVVRRAACPVLTSRK